MKQCKQCSFLNNIFSEIKSNYEYWLFTEMFVYLHNGKDYCNKPYKGENGL